MNRLLRRGRVILAVASGAAMTKKELEFNYACLKIAAAIIIGALIIRFWNAPPSEARVHILLLHDGGAIISTH